MVLRSLKQIIVSSSHCGFDIICQAVSEVCNMIITIDVIVQAYEIALNYLFDFC